MPPALRVPCRVDVQGPRQSQPARRQDGGNIAPRRQSESSSCSQDPASLPPSLVLEEWTAPVPVAGTVANHPEGAPRCSPSTRLRSAPPQTNEVSGRRRCASAKPIRSSPLLPRPHLLTSQGIVADRFSSQHLEGMNHLAALQRENRGGESCIIPDVAAVFDDGRQSVL